MTAATWSLTRSEISNITNEENATITTQEEHGLSNGQVVVLYSSRANGMVFNFTQTTVVEVIDELNFSTTLNTRNKDTFFVATAPPAFTPAQVIPLSGVNENTLN